MVEMAVAAAEQALIAAGREPGRSILSSSPPPTCRAPYPALAIELQHYLGASGLAFDMNVACSSATFGIKTAADMLAAGTARLALVVNPEICSGHPQLPRSGQSLHLWGCLYRRAAGAGGRLPGGQPWQLVASKLVTQYSNNIRNNFGFLNRLSPRTRYGDDKLFRQQGRKVFRRCCPGVRSDSLPAGGAGMGGRWF